MEAVGDKTLDLQAVVVRWAKKPSMVALRAA
jgi:hypothetical protein